MKILVCIKAVPDNESRFKINREGTGYDDAGLCFRVNEYDMFAMEEAVRIRERLGDAEITVVTVGPVRARQQLKKAMALGADHAVLIEDETRTSGGAMMVASLIAAWSGDKRFDLILCGVMSEDLQQCQTGPMLAALLALPWATTVIAEKIADDRKSITCERELEGGVRERIFLPLPALLTIQSGINAPRYASLTNVLRVKEYEVPVIAAASLGAGGKSRGRVRAFIPAPTGACEMIEGGLEEAAAKLLDKIRARVPV